MEIGDRLRKARELRGLGVNQLARLAGVSGATITRWEKGERQPRLRELSRVLGVLRLSYDQLDHDLESVFIKEALTAYETDINDIKLVLGRCPDLSGENIEMIMSIIEGTPGKRS
ncbi:MAG: helix-turn-helix transcriptional regulator [Actinobacteria bacterium]|nr:helix-turn-helix transcriptional regulator [Actinomycetota bacterium]